MRARGVPEYYSGQRERSGRAYTPNPQCMLLSPQADYCALSYAERFLLILYLPPVALPSGALPVPLASVAARGFGCTGSTTSGFASDELFTGTAPVPCVVLSRAPPPRAEGATPLGTGGVLGSLFV